MKNAKNSQDYSQLDIWPRLLKIRPRIFLSIVFGWVFLIFAIFLSVDIFNIINIDINRPAWRFLFNNRVMEWSQWFLFMLTIFSSIYLSAILRIRGATQSALFFLFLGVGLGLMLIEDAGDIRHALSAEARRIFGDQIIGIHYKIVIDLPYFSLLAFFPLYALAKYRKGLMESLTAMKYMLTGFFVYGLAALGSVIGNFNQAYHKMGSWIDNNVLAGRFPIAPGESQLETHFYLMDAVIEETLEFVALALISAAVLVFISEYRNQKIIEIK